MKPKEVKKDLDPLEIEDSEGNVIDPHDYKYVRIGHIDQDRLCDKLVKIASYKLDGELMPSRWFMCPQEEFIDKYGGGQKWAKTKSYHMFILNGKYLFRIWTNTKADYAWIDVCDQMASALNSFCNIEDIPEGNLKKCKPMTKRFKASQVLDIARLVVMVGKLYGISYK